MCQTEVIFGPLYRWIPLIYGILTVTVSFQIFLRFIRFFSEAAGGSRKIFDEVMQFLNYRSDIK